MAVPIEGRTYRHYKGNLYQVIGFASDVNTEEEIVIYRCCRSGKIWARSRIDWESLASNGEERFTLIV